MKNIKNENWQGGFNFDSSSETARFSEFSNEIIDDSYDALNRFYYKENKRFKDITKKRKQAWQ